MLRFAPSTRLWSALLVSASLLGSPLSAQAREGHDATLALAPGGHYEEYARRIEQGEEAAAEGRPLVAVDTYGIAYELLPGTERGGALGAGVVDVSIELARAAKGHPDETVVLEKTLDIVRGHVADVARFNTGSETAAYEVAAAELEQRLSELSPEPVPPGPEGERSSTDPSPSGGVSVSVRSGQPPSDWRHSSRRKAGLGLTTGGSVLTAVGIAFISWGIVFRLRTERDRGTHTDGCREEPAEEAQCLANIDTWYETDTRSANIWLIGGGVSAALGIAALTSGLVLLIRRPSGMADGGRRVRWAGVGVAPQWDGRGFVLSGRFGRG